MNKSEIDAQRQRDLEQYVKDIPKCDIFEERVSFIHAVKDLLEKLYPDEASKVL